MDQKQLKHAFFEVILSFCLLIASQAAFALTVIVPSNTEWVDSTEHAGIAYFLLDSPPSIERYDMDREVFLTSISLSWSPTALAVDDTGIYVAGYGSIVRLDLDGLNETTLTNTSLDATGLLISGDFIYAYFGDYCTRSLLSIDKLSGAQIDQADYFTCMQGLSIAPAQSKMFARSYGVSPSDLVQVILNSDGTLGAQIDSPYHADYPGADKIFVFPAQDRVVDTSGIVYNE